MLCNRLKEKIMFVLQAHSKATIFAADRAASRSARARSVTDLSANENTARGALTVE